jgi:acetolactate synthase-1/2/3 large subunit
MLVADLLVRMLMAHGVEHVFGVPGDTNVGFYQAIRRHAEHIRHVLARDERSAGFMADAYARVSNRPGIVEAPSGAGPMYTLPAVAEAQHSSVALILLTFETPIALEGRGVISEIDSARLFHSICKLSFQVKSAAALPDAIRRAFRVATGDRPGAVHVAIPEDLLEQEVDLPATALAADPACTRFPSAPVGAEPMQVAALGRMLAEAQRPLLVAGGGVNRAAAGPALQDLAEHLGSPVVTSLTGRGALPDAHDLALGVIGDNGFHPHAMRALEAADLVVYLGSKLGSVITVGWTMPSPAGWRRTVQVDLDPATLNNGIRHDLVVRGDLSVVLRQLRETIKARTDELQPWRDQVNGWRRTFWQAAAPELGDAASPLNPAAVMDALNRRIAEPVNIVADAGTPTPYLTRYLRLCHREDRIAIPRAFGGLGYAIPAAVGAWHARPRHRTIALFGDGSFGMSAGELETLVRLQVPALLLNFNNAAFGLIKALQRMRGHNTVQSVDVGATNAARVAEGFGLKAWQVRDRARLEAALDQAWRHDGPALIDILVRSIAETAPPMFGWLKKLGVDPLALEPLDNVPIKQAGASFETPAKRGLLRMTVSFESK